MNDKWNPRLWLRDWLNKPSKAERRAEDTHSALMDLCKETSLTDPIRQLLK